MNDKAKKISPPYATYGSFTSFLNKLRETGVPARIDVSVFGNASGSISYSIIASLKYLKLIDDGGSPSQEFVALVKAADEKRPGLLKEIVRKGYPTLFGAGVDLKTMTAGQFDEHMRNDFEVQGSTVDKIAAFFLGAAKDAGIELSPHLAARKPVASSTSSKKSAKQRKRDGNIADDTPSPHKVQPVTITEKALEYRLVDLMGDAMGDQDVMAAIIKVVTFLKTREAAQKNTATDD